MPSSPVINSGRVVVLFFNKNKAIRNALFLPIPGSWLIARIARSRCWDEFCAIRKRFGISRTKFSVKATYKRLGSYYLYFQPPKDRLFTDNETNTEKVSGVSNATPFVKDAFHDAVINKKNVNELRAKKNRDQICSGL